MRLREPKTTALIFASGKMVVTGAKSTHNAALAAKKFAYVVGRVMNGIAAAAVPDEKTGASPPATDAAAGASSPPPAPKPEPPPPQHNVVDFKVQNIVGTADLGYPIRLEGLVCAHASFASYEPELFPGLIYRLHKPRVVFLVFVSGKVVITGAKTERDVSTALTKLHPVLVEFRKTGAPAFPEGVACPQGGDAADAAAKAAVEEVTRRVSDVAAAGGGSRSIVPGRSTRKMANV